MLGAGEPLLQACNITSMLANGDRDPGLIIVPDAAAEMDAFVAAIAKHRHFARETDPPMV